jgi:hypothetical protein
VLHHCHRSYGAEGACWPRRAGLLVSPLHHPAVTHAVHALFPDNPDFVDYVIWEPRNSKHRRADREPAKVGEIYLAVSPDIWYALARPMRTEG